MHPDFSPAARRLGILSAALVVLLELGYALALAVGLASLPSPAEPIADPMFTVLELCILALAPAVVCLFVAVHAWADPAQKALALAALVFAALMAGITSGLHAVILIARRMPGFEAGPLADLIAFRWPSPAYAVDILAWDVFFPCAVLFAAPIFRGSRLADWIRRLLVTSGGLALAGLSGVVSGDMQLRNVGIVGYVPVFTAAVALIGVFFMRANPSESGAGLA